MARATETKRVKASNISADPQTRVRLPLVWRVEGRGLRRGCRRQGGWTHLRGRFGSPPPDMRWFWSIFEIVPAVPNVTNDHSPTLDEAKAKFTQLMAGSPKL
jgi:hypothetical protein